MTAPRCGGCEWVCEQCGDTIDAIEIDGLMGHGRSEADSDGNEMEVHCGPISCRTPCSDCSPEPKCETCGDTQVVRHDDDPLKGKERTLIGKPCPSCQPSDVEQLREATRWVEENHPLPRCEHGHALRDHGGTPLAPTCGCQPSDVEKLIEEAMDKIDGHIGSSNPMFIDYKSAGSVLRALCREVLEKAAGAPSGTVRFVTDGPPGPYAGRFVELEDAEGRSIGGGEWAQEDEFWVLTIPALRPVILREYATKHYGEETK